MKTPPKERPTWCPKERECQYVYNVGEICIGCCTEKDYLKPWKNSYYLCFGRFQRTSIKTMHMLGLYRCIKAAVAFERQNDPAQAD